METVAPRSDAWSQGRSAEVAMKCGCHFQQHSLWDLESDRTARVLLLSSACAPSISEPRGGCGAIDDGKS